ncbi:hypothetical protein Ancab_039090 [Ancistrocladus abbreviatus]
MGITSLQVCMDSSDWLQGTMSDDGGIDSSSSPSGDILTCSRPAMMERRLRPQHDQALKCPRCESTNTKFCYYNNYSLSQPRYFCKTCRRYWTKGGTLRNIPVGGGCRKNKKNSNSKKSSSSDHQQSVNQTPLGSSSQNLTDLQLSFPEVQFSHLTNLICANGSPGGTSNIMDHSKYNISVLENPRPIDFMESKFEGLVGNIGTVRGYNFMGGGTDFGIVGGIGDMGHHGLAHNFNGFCSPFGVSVDENGSNTFMDTCQRLMLPYHGNDHDHQGTSSMDVKPNTKLLSLEWQDQGCSSDHAAGKDSFGYNVNGLTSWGTSIMNGYGPSTTNPLV